MLEGTSLFKQGYAPKELKKHVKRHANDSFTVPFSSEDEEYSLLPELPGNLVYSDHSGVLLKLRNCEPHTDMLVGNNESDEEYSYEYVGTCFGLLEGKAILQVANDYERLQAGDWVLFNDNLLHSVQANRSWYGLSVQILEKKPLPESVSQI